MKETIKCPCWVRCGASGYLQCGEPLRVEYVTSFTLSPKDIDYKPSAPDPRSYIPLAAAESYIWQVTCPDGHILLSSEPDEAKEFDGLDRRELALLLRRMPDPHPQIEVQGHD